MEDDKVIRDNSGFPMEINSPKSIQLIHDHKEYLKGFNINPEIQPIAFAVYNEIINHNSFSKEELVKLWIRENIIRGNDISEFERIYERIMKEFDFLDKKKHKVLRYLNDILSLLDALAYQNFGHFYKKNYSHYKEQQEIFKKTPFWDIGCYIRYNLELIKGTKLPPFEHLVLHHENYRDRQCFFSSRNAWFLYSTEDIWRRNGSPPHIPWHKQGYLFDKWDKENGGYK